MKITLVLNGGVLDGCVQPQCGGVGWGFTNLFLLPCAGSCSSSRCSGLFGCILFSVIITRPINR